MSSSYFIVAEGLDGSGKTQAMLRLAQRLSQIQHITVQQTHEPNEAYCGGTFIRQALKHEVEANDHTLALAYAVNRADHVQRHITPFLSGEHHVMLCDRYYLSSLVYQSSDNTSMAQVLWLNRTARVPDLTLFFEVSVETSYARIHKRGEKLELFDSKLAALRPKYNEAINLLRARGERIECIDANGTPDDVDAKIIQKLKLCAPDWLNSSL